MWTRLTQFTRSLTAKRTQPAVLTHIQNNKSDKAKITKHFYKFVGCNLISLHFQQNHNWSACKFSSRLNVRTSIQARKFKPPSRGNRWFKWNLHLAPSLVSRTQLGMENHSGSHMIQILVATRCPDWGGLPASAIELVIEFLSGCRRGRACLRLTCTWWKRIHDESLLCLRPRLLLELESGPSVKSVHGAQWSESSRPMHWKTVAGISSRYQSPDWISYLSLNWLMNVMFRWEHSCVYVQNLCWYTHFPWIDLNSERTTRPNSPLQLAVSQPEG